MLKEEGNDTNLTQHGHNHKDNVETHEENGIEPVAKEWSSVYLYIATVYHD